MSNKHNQNSNNNNNNNNNNEFETIMREQSSSTISQQVPIVVRATHEYNPVNNDELHIRVGDLITVTNPEDGGWWEGTLGCKTGWFPSNYVIMVENNNNNGLNNTVNNINSSIVVPQAVVVESNGMSSRGVSAASTTTTGEYRRMIINELVESEAGHVRDMQEFYDNVLKRVGTVLPQSDTSTLISNYPLIISAHTTHLLTPLQQCIGMGMSEQRVGRIFLSAAPHLESVHKTYCSNHPKAVQVVEKHKDKLASWWASFVASSSTTTSVDDNINEPGVLRIIVSLSAPFRRLEKYALVLQEIERHVEEFHRDRGDVQRSVAYYRDMEKGITVLRKQKEMELEVLTPGAIKDFEGSDVGTLGEILLMNLLFVGRERQPRYFVLFSNTILILSYDTTNNTLTYKGRVQVSGITVSSIQDPDDHNRHDNDTNSSSVHAFEIAGPTIHTMQVQCPSKQVKQQWLSTLSELLRATRFPSFGSSPQQYFGHLSPPVQAWNITRLRPSPPYNPFLAEYLGSQGGSSSGSSGKGGGGSGKAHRSTGASSFTGSFIGSSSNNGSSNVSNSFSGFPGGGKTKSFLRIGANPSSVTNEDDFAVLSIVDGFCVRATALNGKDAVTTVGQMSGEAACRGGGVMMRERHKSASSVMSDQQQQRGSSAPLLPSSSNVLRVKAASQQKKKKYSWCCGTVYSKNLKRPGGATEPADPVNNNNSKTSATPPTTPSAITHSHVKSLPMLVNLLRDDIILLHQRIGQLTRQLDEESAARKQLTMMMMSSAVVAGGVPTAGS